MYKHVLQSVSGELDSTRVVARQVRKSERLYPELTTLDIGGHQMFPHRNLIRVASRGDTPSSSRTVGCRDLLLTVPNFEPLHDRRSIPGPSSPTTRVSGRTGHGSSTTRVMASVVPVSHEPRPSNMDVLRGSPQDGDTGSHYDSDHVNVHHSNSDNREGNITPPPAGKRSVLVASPGDSVFHSPEDVSESRVVKKGRRSHGYSLDHTQPARIMSTKKKLFKFHHPIYSPYAMSINKPTGWETPCCWKPILFSIISLIILAVIAVVLVVLLDHFDNPPETTETKTSDVDVTRIVHNIDIYTGQLTIEMSLDDKSEPNDVLPVYSNQELSDWLQATLDEILTDSSLEPLYLYSQIVATDDSAYATKMAFKLYFYQTHGENSYALFTLSSLVKLLDDGLRDVVSELAGYRVNLNSLFLETAPKA